MRSVALWPERLVPIAAPAIAAHLGSEADAAAILEWPLLHDSNVGGWRHWLALFGRTYAPRAQDRRFEDYHLVLEACAQGLGIALARGPIAQPAIRAGRVVVVNELAVDNEVSFHFIRPEEALRPQAATVAQRILRAAGIGDTAIEGFLA